jgi:hypothetical protein
LVAYAAQRGCHVIEDREGSRWATVGLNGHPRVGASEDKEFGSATTGPSTLETNYGKTIWAARPEAMERTQLSPEKAGR